MTSWSIKERKIRCVCTTLPGWGIRSFTMTRRWRRNKAGPQWGRWRVVYTTKWVSDWWWLAVAAFFFGSSVMPLKQAVDWVCWCDVSRLWLLSPVKYERIKFLVIALKNAVEVYAWAPKPYHKFMAFKVSSMLRRIICSWSQMSLKVDDVLSLH